MKSMWPPLMAIFFMTYFYRAKGDMVPLVQPDPLLGVQEQGSNLGSYACFSYIVEAE